HDSTTAPSTLSLHDALPIYTADMPYLNTLATNYGVATNYYANTHPSLNNYFYLTAGRAGTRAPWVRLLADEFPGEVGGDSIASIDRKSTRLNSSHVAISYAV